MTRIVPLDGKRGTFGNISEFVGDVSPEVRRGHCPLASVAMKGIGWKCPGSIERAPAIAPGFFVFREPILQMF
jgi:hypothetical protein